jgi:hypothetical protein
MASDNHNDIKQFLEQSASGRMPTGKRMVFNTRTGKFEVRTSNERPGDDVPNVEAQDMRAFGGNLR